MTSATSSSLTCLFAEVLPHDSSLVIITLTKDESRGNTSENKQVRELEAALVTLFNCYIIV